MKIFDKAPVTNFSCFELLMFQPGILLIFLTEKFNTIYFHTLNSPMPSMSEKAR